MSEDIFDNPFKGDSYIDDMNTFMKIFNDQGGNMAAGEVGGMVVRMSMHYMQYNMRLQRAMKIFNSTAQQIYAGSENGKPISASKAEIIASATPEAAAYQEAKVHVQNIEQHINALKALQRGVLNEYSHSAT